MTKKHKTIRAISGVLIAALIVFLSYHEWKGEAPAMPGMGSPKVIVTASPVVIEDAPINISVFGSLRALDSAMITSEISGIITELSFTEGQRVEKGTALIHIDDVMYKAEVAKANAQLELNTVEYQRRESLISKQAISRQEVDQAKANLDISAAELAIANANLDHAHIKAPFNGTLGVKNLSVGQYVSAGEPLLEIVDNQQLKLTYSVSEQYLSQIALDQTVDLTTNAYPNDTFHGVVNFISPSINPTTRTLMIEAVIDNADGRLSPGLSVNLTHVLGHEKNGLKIPEESLLPTIEGYKVFIIEGDVANSVNVEIQSRIKGFVYISKGLKEGDIVVTTGQEKLRDGNPIEILSTTGE